MDTTDTSEAAAEPPASQKRRTESGTPLLPAPTWKDEDEDDEDERSQLVSLSEMSGTTQPTEEPGPGQLDQLGGPCGGPVAPCCLSWTRRRAGDNGEDDDDDMEMASEDVTESGLESYGNADEDDFAEVDRLDNLNRAAQLPPPPQLPSAPAAQWDQPNPLKGSWAEQQAASTTERRVPMPPRQTPSSSSPATDDEASDMEGEAQLEDSLEPLALQPPAQRCLSTVDEGEEVEQVEEDVVEGLVSRLPHPVGWRHPPQESWCVVRGGASAPPTQQLYIQCGTQEDECAEPSNGSAPHTEDAATSVNCVKDPDDLQPPYFTAICEKTENFTGFTAPPHRRHPSAHATSCDVIQPSGGTLPRLTCADLPPRTVAQQALSPQLRRLEQHQRQLLELQRSREQKNRPLEEAEQQRKRREEEEQRRKKEEAEEEIKRNEEEPRLEKVSEQQQLEDEEQRRHLQLQQQEEELKQRQQLLQWQQELQQSDRGNNLLLSPSSGLCTIYEALETSDNEAQEEERRSEGKERLGHETSPETDFSGEQVKSVLDKHRDSPPSSRHALSHTDSPQSPSNLSQDGDSSSPCPPETPEHLSPSDLDWGQKVDIVQQLINQTLLLNRDRCSSLLLLPGGAGGTLSPLESSLWPRLLPPLTPPSATVTSVSSFSPEATGASPQGEWTVVELETHH
ncbi:unnamed protein product [Lampetra planeri]